MDYTYYVYIVCSNTGTLYIGMTNDICRRMKEHKSGEFEGFASKYGCNRLVYYESYGNVLKAISREKQLKGWRREKKVALIERDNPRWQGPGRALGSRNGFPARSSGREALKTSPLPACLRSFDSGVRPRSG